MLGLALVTACASAGAPGDGDPGIDAPRPVDARIIDTPPPDLCPSMQTCQTPTMLGQISGDTNSPMLTAMGYQSAWLRVRVTEDYNDILNGRSLRALVRLTSPASADFDVFTYVNKSDDEIECSTTIGTPTMNGTVNEVKAQWGEGGSPNASNDSRWLSIEIRPVSGRCNPSQTWQLVVQGNAN